MNTTLTQFYIFKDFALKILILEIFALKILEIL